jgi:hypothetical protein
MATTRLKLNADEIVTRLQSRNWRVCVTDLPNRYLRRGPLMVEIPDDLDSIRLIDLPAESAKVISDVSLDKLLYGIELQN